MNECLPRPISLQGMTEVVDSNAQEMGGGGGFPPKHSSAASGIKDDDRGCLSFLVIQQGRPMTESAGAREEKVEEP